MLLLCTEQSPTIAEKKLLLQFQSPTEARSYSCWQGSSRGLTAILLPHQAGKGGAVTGIGREVYLPATTKGCLQPRGSNQRAAPRESRAWKPQQKQHVPTADAPLSAGVCRAGYTWRDAEKGLSCSPHQCQEAPGICIS